MCGRYYIKSADDSDELKRIIDILQRKEGVLLKTGEIRPTDMAPVITNNRSMTAFPFIMRWGFTGQGGKPIINARSETAATKPMFRDGMMQRRCLVLASHYFEWERKGSNKIKYAIKPTGCETMYMAGLYRKESDSFSFTILTREPAENIAFIHDRMPVLLPQSACMDWLNIRYAAEDVIQAAITDMQYELADHQQYSFLS